ncbi:MULTISPECIES: DUF6414 family protein [Cellulosimicrobium]|uniref:DUF6414 family protein n=1 Tax=Cellulosimicrobium TaxID=157920 RepID=UPI001BA7F49F|nr:hypothetical protein [Cellulosimicrobium cellulans]QUC01882.1 hypothetical protein J5A69_19760 [Cellulosimicrobium cellulans]
MTTEPLSPEEQVKDQVLAPTVTIYQHGEHVAGVVQQFFERPLVVDETFENEGTSSTGQKSEHNAGVQVAGEANTPLIAKVKAQADYSYLRGHEGASATSTRAVQNFVYSQAYYLNLVRKALRDAEVLRTVANLDDARHLKAGDFVEYRAWFRPSEVTTLMDVVTPELVETITRTQHKLSEAKLFEGYGTHEDVQKAALRIDLEAGARGELAGAITRAVKTDFRSTTTREYYGAIASGDATVTAVTICDTGHFTVDDEDRILDGEFTVLGKVTSSLEADAPILRRNKLLSRIGADGVDALAKFIATAADNLEPNEGSFDASQVDLTFSSRVSGESFRVVPLAIYV